MQLCKYSYLTVVLYPKYFYVTKYLVLNLCIYIKLVRISHFSYLVCYQLFDVFYSQGLIEQYKNERIKWKEEVLVKCFLFLSLDQELTFKLYEDPSVYDPKIHLETFHQSIKMVSVNFTVYYSSVNLQYILYIIMYLTNFLTFFVIICQLTTVPWGVF